MSSVKYKDKGLEEIRSIIERYRDTYVKLFGHLPDALSLKSKLEEFKHQKEQEIFAQCFGDLSVKNVADAVVIVTEQMKASEPTKKKFFAKG
jgi:hypothetical protein